MSPLVFSSQVCTIQDSIFEETLLEALTNSQDKTRKGVFTSNQVTSRYGMKISVTNCYVSHLVSKNSIWNFKSCIVSTYAIWDVLSQIFSFGKFKVGNTERWLFCYFLLNNQSLKISEVILEKFSRRKKDSVRSDSKEKSNSYWS